MYSQTLTKRLFFRTRLRFFPLSSLTAAKSARRNWTVNCQFLLTSLSSSLGNWTPPWISIWQMWRWKPSSCTWFILTFLYNVTSISFCKVK